jgi:hypothetical protein
MGGAIFTWGGDFKWSQPGVKDHHQGCLGVGDLSGRLVPTLVKGEDNHVQVACGLNFTVALTNNGEVYQMGSTGAQNNREKDKADWKVCVALWAGCTALQSFGAICTEPVVLLDSRCRCCSGWLSLCSTHSMTAHVCSRIVFVACEFGTRHCH